MSLLMRSPPRLSVFPTPAHLLHFLKSSWSCSTSHSHGERKAGRQRCGGPAGRPAGRSITRSARHIAPSLDRLTFSWRVESWGRHIPVDAPHYSCRNINKDHVRPNTRSPNRLSAEYLAHSSIAVHLLSTSAIWVSNILTSGFSAPLRPWGRVNMAMMV